MFYIYAHTGVQVDDYCIAYARLLHYYLDAYKLKFVISMLTHAYIQDSKTKYL